MRDLRLVLRHEDMADGIFAGLRQDDALQRHFLAEEAVGNLHENARAIAHQGIGADGAAMRQVFEDEQAVLDDLVRLLALHMRDEADAAGIVLVARIIKALFFRQDRKGGIFFNRPLGAQC
jgi:hypothetical protein